MKLFSLLLTTLLLGSVSAQADDWQVLFDESTGLKHWKAAENPESVRLEDNQIVLNGKRAHLFYMGEDGSKPSWKNFEAELQFKTTKNSNSGLFFHTAWQDSSWPMQGLECQVNATHEDWRKTGSIYAFKDIREPGHKDDEWTTMTLRVEGMTCTVHVNGVLTNTWTQPEDHKLKTKRLGQGTFALQAHDPGSKTIVRLFKVRHLP